MFRFASIRYGALIRCNEHIGINRNGREVSSPSPSSIRDHVKQTGHIACKICANNNSQHFNIESSLNFKKVSR